MTATLRFAHLLALVIWVGGVIFFSFVTAPSLFGALPRELAGRATAAIFPRYYLLGTICGGVAILTAIGMGLRAGPAEAGSLRRAVLAELVLLVAMTGLTLYAGQVLLPQASAARLELAAPEGTPAHDAANARFGRLHRRSVLINGAVLLLGLGTVLIVSLRPTG